MIVEPINASTMISKKYYLRADVRKNVFGSEDIR